MDATNIFGEVINMNTFIGRCRLTDAPGPRNSGIFMFYNNPKDVYDFHVLMEPYRIAGPQQPPLRTSALPNEFGCTLYNYLDIPILEYVGYVRIGTDAMEPQPQTVNWLTTQLYYMRTIWDEYVEFRSQEQTHILQ